MEVSIDQHLPNGNVSALQDSESLLPERRLTRNRYTKIFMQFPPDQVFWDKDTQFLLYADPRERGYYPVFQSLDGPGFLEESGILFVTVVQDQSYQVESQNASTTQEEVMAVLRKMVSLPSWISQGRANTHISMAMIFQNLHHFCTRAGRSSLGPTDPTRIGLKEPRCNSIRTSAATWVASTSLESTRVPNTTASFKEHGTKDKRQPRPLLLA